MFDIVLLFICFPFKTITLARIAFILLCILMPVKIQNNRFLSEIENCREKICLSTAVTDNY